MNLLVIPAALVLMMASCSNKKEMEALRRRIIDDSVQHSRALDSLGEADFRSRLADHRNTFGIPSIEDPVDEAYQLFVEFSWGKSPVGAFLSILAEKRGTHYTLVVHTFPDRKRLETKMDMKESDFRHISDFLDSIHFDVQPVHHTIDYTLHDASRYTIESLRNGKYHAISRSDTVESYVYELVADVAEASAISPDLVKELRRAVKGEVRL